MASLDVFKDSFLLFLDLILYLVNFFSSISILVTYLTTGFQFTILTPYNSSGGDTGYVDFPSEPSCLAADLDLSFSGIDTLEVAFLRKADQSFYFSSVFETYYFSSVLGIYYFSTFGLSGVLSSFFTSLSSLSSILGGLM